jgi:hypothetical protein
VSFALPTLRVRRASDDVARDFAGRIVRASLAGLGVLVVLSGILIAPLPGPGGLPVVVVGLMLVLRNSFKARRQFVRFQRAHPKMVSPVRRLLRRDPQIIQFAWQQMLRIERLIVPRSLRLGVRGRRFLKRRFRPIAASSRAG